MGKNRQSSISNLQAWLRDNGHSDKYTEWVTYCVDNDDKTTTLSEWLMKNYPDLWRQYNGS